MQHTLVAVFDNRTDAQNALNELLSSGFTRTDVRLSSTEADTFGQSDSLSTSSDLDTARSADGDTGITASIKNFFGDLFGSDNAEHVNRYEGAVNSGRHVLTLVANSLPEVERGADIVERYGPTDIDETSSGTPDLASTGFSSGAMHAGSTIGMQQASSMSAQSSSTSTGSVQAASIPSLDNPGDRQLFQHQESLGTSDLTNSTHQEPLGQSGLTATGGTSLQGSTLRDTAIQGSALEGSIRQGSTAVDRGDSLQRDTSMGGVGTSGTRFTDKQRNRVRIFSRGQSDAAMGAATGFESGSGSSAMGGYSGDDTYYRNHFDTTYGATGASYDEYAPAYSYGSEAARSGRYTNGAWDDIEADLRNDWDSRYANGGEPSTWEKMKAAVRHGWERMTRDDDDMYRGHYDSTYAASGEKYDDLKPAYSYGTEMRRSEMYRNRPWDDVETDLRTGWDNRIDGTREFSTTGSDSSEPSAWDRVKNAVRHGWDKMTDDNDDDIYYRNHWNSVYGSTGGAYDEYRPAYNYGTAMAREEKYRNRPWADVETDLRSDWDNRYPGEQSTWDKMKSAVRHGWERMMR
jgi:uncharacterized protein YjbJ (UPF0337 family)